MIEYFKYLNILFYFVILKFFKKVSLFSKLLNYRIIFNAFLILDN